MRMLNRAEAALHWREDGDPSGRPLVFANSLGTDLRLWDALLPHLPSGLRLIRYDMRGHGLSSCPPGPYDMETLARDAEALIAHLDLANVTFIGLSIGGMVGQALAARRPDLISALVLSNTAAAMGTPEAWEARIAAIRAGGIEAISEAVMERWFAARFRATPELALWRNMLTRTPPEGYIGCCAAIAGADLRATTAGLTLPTLAIAGVEDGASPPDLVADTARLIPGAQLATLPDTGHLPCVEAPAAYAAILSDFLKETAHV